MARNTFLAEVTFKLGIFLSLSLTFRVKLGPCKLNFLRNIFKCEIRSIFGLTKFQLMNRSLWGFMNAKSCFLFAFIYLFI